MAVGFDPRSAFEYACIREHVLHQFVSAPAFTAMSSSFKSAIHTTAIPCQCVCLAVAKGVGGRNPQSYLLLPLYKRFGLFDVTFAADDQRDALVQLLRLNVKNVLVAIRTLPAGALRNK